MSMNSQDRIVLDHGSGGKLTHLLIEEIIAPYFENPDLSVMHDGAMLPWEKGRVAFSTDTFVVDPIFFPGGNIADLAVNGTVNDLAMCGAVPKYLSMGLILEEGFMVSWLQEILSHMKNAVEKAGVRIVTGDTKVVPKGAADRIFINTSGIGWIPEKTDVSPKRAKPKDKIIISGTIADHGIAVLTKREGLSFETDIKSDTCALNHLVEALFSVCPDIHVLRDPTRGGVGTTLCEIAKTAGVGIRILENAIPIHPQVASLCEVLGFDPLYIANEGKLIAIVEDKDASAVLEAARSTEEGKNAAIIGEVVPEHPGKVVMETPIQGERIVDMLAGQQFPRIC